MCILVSFLYSLPQNILLYLRSSPHFIGCRKSNSSNEIPGIHSSCSKKDISGPEVADNSDDDDDDDDGDDEDDDDNDVDDDDEDVDDDVDDDNDNSLGIC